MIRRILKILLKGWIAIWALIFVFIALLLIEQMISDYSFIREEMNPAIKYIDEFKSEKGRLPIDKEFHSWRENRGSSVWYYRSSAGLTKVKNQKINWDENYLLSVWRSEWTMYYYSWSDEYDTNNYTLVGLLMDLFWVALPSLIPLLILRFYRKAE